MILALFFTRSVSLKVWQETGLLEREKLIYEALLNQKICSQIYWLTYGSEDAAFAQSLKEQGKLHAGINVVAMPKWLESRVGKVFYSFFMPILQRKILKGVDVIKTNQLDGSWTAVIAKSLYKKPLILRCGYMWSLFAKKRKNKAKLDIFSGPAESLAYRKADHAIVASQADATYVQSRFQMDLNKMSVIPNFVDINLFQSKKDFTTRRSRFIFVGRFEEQKNLFSLMEAIAHTDIGCDFYGEGQLDEDLRKYADKLNVDVVFKGVVPNDQLPDILNTYKYFILPSYYEGTPKALLEAMSCGCVCLGTNIPGIKEIIQNTVNGYLIDQPDAYSILSVIKKVITTNNQATSQAAVEHIQKLYSLNSIVQKEAGVLKAIVK